MPFWTFYKNFFFHFRLLDLHHQRRGLCEVICLEVLSVVVLLFHFHHISLSVADTIITLFVVQCQCLSSAINDQTFGIKREIIVVMWGCSLFCQQQIQILFTEGYVIDIIKKRTPPTHLTMTIYFFGSFFLLNVMRIVPYFKSLNLKEIIQEQSHQEADLMYMTNFLLLFPLVAMAWCDVSDVCLLFVLRAAPSPDNWELHNINQASLDSINYINSQKWSWYLLRAQSTECFQTGKIVKTFPIFPFFHFLYCVYNSYTVWPIHIQMH